MKRSRTRNMSDQGRSHRLTRQALLLAGVTALTAALASAQQTALADSQVEANVLKALAGAPDLASEAITTSTVYGTVTLSGTVRDEALRREAETLASKAVGVKKVVDELQLGTALAQNDASPQPQEAPAAAAPDQASRLVLQSDGTYAPANDGAPGSAPAATAQRNDPDADQALDQQVQAQAQPQQAQPYGDPSAQGQQLPPMSQSAPNATGAPYGTQSAPGSGVAGQNQPAPYPGRRPMYGYPSPGYPPNPYGYPSSNGQGYPPYAQGPGYGQNPGSGMAPGYGGPGAYAQAPYGAQSGGQAGGQVVVVPAGTMVRVRVNRPLSSDRSQPGQPFDGVVVNDIVAGGQVAIPRGASVQGKVVDAQSSGVLKGRGELSIQLTDVILGGRSYPIVSNVSEHHGGDKTTETIDKTAGIGALGAVVGAVAGGGVGAAVGGGVGAAVGLGSSAASGRGQVYIPSEGVLSFELAQQAEVTTVSQQEMQRLAYGVPPGAEPRFRRPGPGVYFAPGYYPGFYPGYYPYGYPRY